MRINISKLSRIILSGIVFVGISFSALAADISALNFNGDVLGKVIPDGSVINFDNELIGHITADGFVVNDDNDLIGGIVPQGIAISYNNSILGKVNNDGTVTTINDNLVGKVLPNGLVVNDNYDVLGAVISPGLVYDDKGSIAGRISGDGKFYNLSGENSGFVTASGYVFEISGTEKKTTLAGKLISSKMVVSSNGKFLGSIAPDGKVIDLKKSLIGNVHANGFVYNPDGKVVGHIVEEGYAFSSDGSYLGVISYSGEVVNKGNAVALAVYGNRVINKNGDIIGFTISMSATANRLDGSYLGRIAAGGNVVKGRNVVGKIGASGNVIDNTGKVIGTINGDGPLFEYRGQLRANAAVGGKVISLEGVELGFMQREDAFDRKGKRIGRLLGNRLNFDKSNTFIGISGISSIMDIGGKNYTTSPYGYIFDETGIVNGRNFPLANIYTPEGNVLAYTSENGETENSSLNEIAKLTSAGIFIDKNNKPLGKNIEALYATDFIGNMLGYINPANLVIDSKNKAFAKILPDNNVVGLAGKLQQNYGRASNAALSISINGDYLGVNNLDGKVINANEVVGKISSNNYVIDNMGALYGSVMPFGAVMTADCKFLGVVSDSGDARTAKDAYIGMVLANKQVVNETEEVVGYVVQPERVNGRNGEVIGVSTPLGTVLNYKNQNLGCVDMNGFARNGQNEIIGQIIPYSSVMDFNNKIIGYTDFAGNVADSNGIQIANIDVDGNIRSKGGANAGVLFRYTVAFDNNNVYLGRVNPDGNVVSDAGENLGRVNYNGYVVTKNKQNGFALYDLYVYDNDGKTIGYIAKNGRVYSIMGDMKGAIYKGFVLDKKQNLVGRGARDYYIRNNEKEIVGYLNLDGKVINSKNIEIGNLRENGDVIDNDGKIIAKADSLQYYQKPAEPANTEDEISSGQSSSSPEEMTKNQTPSGEETGEDVEEDGQESGDEGNPEEQPGEKTDAEREAENTRINHKVVGIAVTPGGKYIGDVYSNNQVIDDTGAVVGKIDDNGEMTDDEGNTVGVFQERKEPDAKAMNTKWWQNVAKGATVSPYETGDKITNVGDGGGIGPGGRYNPKRAAILAQLQDDRRRSMTAAMIKPGYNAASYTGWQDDWGVSRSVSTLRVDMSNMITEDKPIPAVLARSVISLGEAPVTAIVERNIYGDSGRNVIIPAGSRVIGGLQTADVESRFDNSSGGVKLKITWSRIIRPDGIAFLLSSAQTGDAQGRGGGALGYVDEQLVKKYTLPIVGTLASSAITYMMAADEDNTGEVENSKQQAASDARQEFMDKMDQILQEIIDSKSMIQPVTYIPAGTRVIIYPMTDLWLKSTKEIELGIETTIPGTGDGGLVNDYTRSGASTKSTSEVQNSNNSQKVVLGNQAQNNQDSGGDGLVNENPQNNQNSQQRKRPVGAAIPPPAADGSAISVPDSEEDIQSGDIVLF